MNHALIHKICQRLDLGTPTIPAERIYGGLLHKMWKLTTDKNSYAIKARAPGIDFKNQASENSYELSEKIDTIFDYDGIPAISAIHKDGDYLVEIDGAFFLIYPWVNAKTLPSNQPISDQHGIKIAALISKIHTINLNIFSLPSSQDPEFNTLSSEQILEAIKNSQAKKAPFATELKKHQKILLMLNQKYLDSIPHLKKQSVISHGDLDPKNVLWDAEDQPILIDWESARRLNPTHEIINACFDWSGISLENNFNKNLFFKILEAYQKAGSALDQNLLAPTFYAVAGNWIHWMIFNIQRFCETQDSEVLNLSAEQVSQTLRTIVLLENLIPTLCVPPAKLRKPIKYIFIFVHVAIDTVSGRFLRIFGHPNQPAYFKF